MRSAVPKLIQMRQIVIRVLLEARHVALLTGALCNVQLERAENEVYSGLCLQMKPFVKRYGKCQINRLAVRPVLCFGAARSEALQRLTD